ncbi:hypothetical protein ACWGIG_33060, partial [Streptomyces sp. NPDC054863]
MDTLPPPPATAPPQPPRAAGPPHGGEWGLPCSSEAESSGKGGQGGGPHAERSFSRPHALATAPSEATAPSGPTASHPPRRPRTPARLATLAAATILGTGLIAGAAAGSWLAADTPRTPTASTRFADARTAWRNIPVDTLFPRALKG